MEKMNDDLPPPYEEKAEAPEAPEAPQRPRVQLSAQQNSVVDAVVSGKSVLITGEAGVGKSEILAQMARRVTAAGRQLALTATTGNAAINIPDCITLHSFMGCGLPRENTFPAFWNALKRNKRAQERLRTTDVLVIDEISFAAGRLVVILDLLCRTVRGTPDKPFGGIQMVFTGDFLQLPPVCRKDQEPWGLLFAFDVFNLIGISPYCYGLSEVFRQRDDPRFREFLARARTGQTTPSDRQLLLACRTTTFPDDGVLATRLLPTNAEVQKENESMLCSEPNEGATRRIPFRGKVVALQSVSEKQAKRMKEEQLAQAEAEGKRLEDLPLPPRSAVVAFKSRDERLELERRVVSNTAMPMEMYVRQGMQVLFRANLDVANGIANGTRGACIGFVEREDLDRARCNATVVPLAKDLVAELLVQDPDPDDQDLVPLVYVPAVDTTYAVFEHGFESALGAGRFALYMRLPFIAAWAITVHRSQGMTLDRLEVYFKRRPFPAQAYVAVSRVRSRKCLKLRGELPGGRLFRANMHALEFFNAQQAGAVFGKQRQWPELDGQSAVAVTYAKWRKYSAKAALSKVGGTGGGSGGTKRKKAGWKGAGGGKGGWKGQGKKKKKKKKTSV